MAAGGGRIRNSSYLLEITQRDVTVDGEVDLCMLVLKTGKLMDQDVFRQPITLNPFCRVLVQYLRPSFIWKNQNIRNGDV